MYSLSGGMQFNKKFETMCRVDNPCVKPFEELLGYLKPVQTMLCAIVIEGDLYSNVRLMAPEGANTLYDKAMCVELASNDWLVSNSPEEEPNIFSLDIRVLTDEEGKMLINGVPEGFTQAKSHWCARLDGDDESVKDEHIKVINVILADLTAMTISHNGFVSGTDLLHCIFSFPFNGKVISITATSEKVAIV